MFNLLAVANAAHASHSLGTLGIVATIVSLFALGATVNDQTQLAGLFKEVYAKSVVDAYSFLAPLASKYIKFDYQEAGLGNKYHQPVDLQLEHSFTCAAAGTVPTYLAINAGIMQDAQLEGSQIFGRSAVSYEAISRAAEAGKKAFESATKRVVKRLSMSHLRRLETQLITGQRGIAAGSAISGTSTTRALTVSDNTWSAARFSGMVGATLRMVRANNSTIVAPSNGAAGTFYLSSINTTTKVLNITADSTDATAMDTYWPLGGILYWETASVTTEMPGLDAWCNMSGTFANIATGTYDLWNPNVYSTTTGVISFGKIVEAAEMMAPYGTVEKIVAVVPVKAFSVLNTDLAALRQYDSSYKTTKGELGVKGISFSTSVGEIEILPHPLQQDGTIHMFVPDEALRTGSTDITFITRGSGGEKLILESATTPAGEMRTMSNQALFIEQPRHLVLMDGITYG